MKTQEELEAMSESEYAEWAKTEPLPKDLAGFQQVTNGVVRRGDLCVVNRSAYCWADVTVGSDPDFLAFRIYRRMPVDSHESIYQKSVEVAAPVYRELEEGEIIQAGDEFSFGGKWITWNLSDTAVGLEYNELYFCKNTRTTRPKPGQHAPAFDPKQDNQYVPTTEYGFKFHYPDTSTPSFDPKGDAGKLKPQLQLIPPVLSQETAKALSLGSKRYGPWNWRENKVEVMTYIGAMKRHLDCILEGEDIDPESGAHHLGHVAASCGIVLDAQKHGTLVDNRPNIPQSGTAESRSL